MNPNLFAPASANTVRNNHGVEAHQLSPKDCLANLASVTTFNDSFYVKDMAQFTALQVAATYVDDEYLAKTIVYSATKAKMKDVPLVLLVLLFKRNVVLAKKVFKLIINDGRSIRKFVQVVRSGACGRKSLGSSMKNCIRDWFYNASEYSLLNASIGADFSLADVVKLIHLDPEKSKVLTPTQMESWIGWLLKKNYSFFKLPEITKKYVDYVQADEEHRFMLPLPPAPFMMVSSFKKTAQQFETMISRMSWNQLRINAASLTRTISTFDALDFVRCTELLVARLKDADAIRRSKIGLYQMFAAIKKNSEENNQVVTESLKHALTVLLSDVPKLPDETVLMLDISSSMKQKVTGDRGTTPSTVVTNIDVAALMTAAFIGKNPAIDLIVFNTEAVLVEVDNSAFSENGTFDVFKLAQVLTNACAGGTDTCVPLNMLLQLTVDPTVEDYLGKVNNVIMISDNETNTSRNVAACHQTYLENKNGTINWNFRPIQTQFDIWDRLTTLNPDIKGTFIDISPGGTTQVPDQHNAMNVAGFSDEIFNSIARRHSSDEAEVIRRVSELIEEIVL